MIQINEEPVGFLDLYKEHPFSVAGAVTSAGLAASFASAWWVIVLAVFVGLLLGNAVDSRSHGC